jgi:hypothetical protein
VFFKNLTGLGGRGFPLKLQPEETIWRQGKAIWMTIHCREFHIAEHFHRNHALEF